MPAFVLQRRQPALVDFFGWMLLKRGMENGKSGIMTTIIDMFWGEDYSTRQQKVALYYWHRHIFYFRMFRSPIPPWSIRLPRYFRHLKRNAWSLSKAYFYWDRYEFTKIFSNFLEHGFQRKCVLLGKWKKIILSYYYGQMLEPQRFQGPSFR